MTIQSGLDLIIALLYAPGKIEAPAEKIAGITRLEKLIFLLLKEGGFEDSVGRDFPYKPYDLGPYSSEILDYLETLKEVQILATEVRDARSYKESMDAMAAQLEASEQVDVERPKLEIYQLTDRGLKVGERLFDDLTEEEQAAIVDIKRRFNRASLNELLRYVYEKYPKMREKSKIADRILGFGRRPDLPPFRRED
ncbi:MAG: hypothetical protein ACE5IJ_05385 [Thermoplasmata archaeon]